jgi:flavin reductase (DIM6/NTAB) family NADH-FMN oxidoreductase RutF
MARNQSAPRIRRGRPAASKPAPVGKEVWKPGTMLNPVPVVLVTSIGRHNRPNVMTVAWTGTVCSDPPMVSISLRSETLSHGLIQETREFVVNVPTAQMVRAVDYCGVLSGRNVDKFEKTGLTPVPASKVQPPVLRECPINLECMVRQEIVLGLHTLFIGEIVAVQVNGELINAEGRFAIEKAGLLAYAHGGYYALGRKLGFFGFSVQRKRARRPGKA